MLINIIIHCIIVKLIKNSQGKKLKYNLYKKYQYKFIFVYNNKGYVLFWTK